MTIERISRLRRLRWLCAASLALGSECRCIGCTRTGCAVLMQTGGGPSLGITRCQLCHLSVLPRLSTRFEQTRPARRASFRIWTACLSLSLSPHSRFSLVRLLPPFVFPSHFLYTSFPLSLSIYLSICRSQFSTFRVYLLALRRSLSFSSRKLRAYRPGTCG